LFASEIQATLDGSLPGDRLVVSYVAPAGNKFVVKLQDEKMPLRIDGKVVAYLGCAMDQQLARTGRYLKTVGSKVTVWSKLNATPVRLCRPVTAARAHTAAVGHSSVTFGPGKPRIRQGFP